MILDFQEKDEFEKSVRKLTLKDAVMTLVELDGDIADESFYLDCYRRDLKTYSGKVGPQAQKVHTLKEEQLWLRNYVFAKLSYLEMLYDPESKSTFNGDEDDLINETADTILTPGGETDD